MLRFGRFELDESNFVLRKDGAIVKLAPQPFRALVYLARRSNQLVTRDELRQVIWGNEVVVDFEHGLNTCVRQIRAALDESEGEPSVLETVPKLGYRFLPHLEADHRIHNVWILGAAAAVVIVGAAVLWLGLHGRLLERTGLRSDPAAPGSTTNGRSNEHAEAYALIVRGRLALDQRWTPVDGVALNLFQRAALLDPSNPEALAGIAEAYRQRGFFGRMPAHEAYPLAREAADRAVALGPFVSQTHLARADIETWFEQNGADAEPEYRQAIALDPGNGKARQQYALWLTLRERFTEAWSEASVARELDPLSASAVLSETQILLYSRRYNECLKSAEQALSLDPSHSPAYQVLGQCHQWRGELDEAIAAYQRSGRQSGNLGHAYAVAGRTAEARRVLDELLARHGSSGAGGTAVEIAQLFIGLGDQERAFEWLDRGRAEGAWLGTLRVAPLFDPLRRDPRFDRLLRSSGLIQPLRGSSVASK